MNEQIFGADGAPVRAVACAVYPQGGEAACEASLNELTRLLETAGAVKVGELTQMRPKPDGATCIGSGKLRELSELCAAVDATLVVFDCELTPSQLHEIEDGIETEVDVLDRSMLILDIFARHAVTSEGRLQVELAQLRYTAPRLIGKGKELSRLGGGIGTRGPGESKLEIDRRRLKTRIRTLEEELERVETNRAVMRAARDRSGLVRCAIVGYTNAGKSTLLNALTDAGILAENKLFATLDPTTRQYDLPSGMKLLLTDTVGFIRNLPHHLIKAFRSTLEEAVYADVILVVIDASDPDFAEQLEVTLKLLEELGAGGKPTMFVYNKCDLLSDPDRTAQMRNLARAAEAESVFISAVTGAGMDVFAAALEALASAGRRRVTFRLPYSDGAALSLLHKEAHGVEVSYEDDAVVVSAVTDARLRGRLARYLAETPTASAAEEGEADE